MILQNKLNLEEVNCMKKADIFIHTENYLVDTGSLEVTRPVTRSPPGTPEPPRGHWVPSTEELLPVQYVPYRKRQETGRYH